MATLNTKLALSSTDISSDDLGISISSTLTVGPPSIGVSKVAIAAAGGTATTLVPSGAANQYVYIKHTGYQADGSTATTNQVAIELASNADLLRLSPGEFCFFTSKSSSVVEVLSSSSQTILVEYAYWSEV